MGQEANPFSVAIGDVNGDGKPDLATANYGGNNVSVLINKGVGGFRPKLDYATGPNPFSVAIGDLNGDGKLDLATANSDADTATVLLNAGDGTFLRGVDYPAGYTPIRSRSAT